MACIAINGLARVGRAVLKIIEQAGRALREADADKAVTAAVDFADAGPPPEVGALFDYVYASPPAGMYRGLPGDPVTGGGPA